MALKVFFVSIAALLFGSALDYVRADEAYLCDSNIVVMVPPGELERMKREDPCVASHFGLVVDTTRLAIPLPSPHPRRLTGNAIATAHATPPTSLRGIQSAETASSRIHQFAGTSVRLINRSPGVAD